MWCNKHLPILRCFGVNLQNGTAYFLKSYFDLDSMNGLVLPLYGYCHRIFSFYLERKRFIPINRKAGHQSRCSRLISYFCFDVPVSGMCSISKPMQYLTPIVRGCVTNQHAAPCVTWKTVISRLCNRAVNQNSPDNSHKSFAHASRFARQSKYHFFDWVYC